VTGIVAEQNPKPKFAPSSDRGAHGRVRDLTWPIAIFGELLFDFMVEFFSEWGQ